MSRSEELEEARGFLEDRTEIEPEIGLILGSGLGELGTEVEEAVRLPYDDIPGFLESNVEGHAGELVLGTLDGVPVYLMNGRYHYYEGHDIDRLVFPVQLMPRLGIHTMLVTNASGAVNEEYEVGDLVLLKDHVNFLGANPLRGDNDPKVGPRFVDMTYAYDPDLRELAHSCAPDHNIRLREGIYVASAGPTYETPAEVNMYRTIGADLCGMSTVPEVIAANHAGLDVLGISCVTNMAAGVLDQPLSHEEVIETTERAKREFKPLVRSVVTELAGRSG